MRTADKERVLVEVTSRVLERRVQDARSGGMPLENLLNDTLFHERKRLEREAPSGYRDADMAVWNEVGRVLGHAPEEQLRDLLKRIIERYVLEVMGNFNETFYNVTSNMMPMGLGLMLNGLSPRRLLQPGSLVPSLHDSVRLSGNLEQLQKLQHRGTILLVPTHSSHMDSIALGWALHELGLPPFLYGAGFNLFMNPIMGFFMGNLGAYRVDRKKKNGLYKEVLKVYATYALELGYNNLFFPGGTRSRSGAIEQNLKLGLAGTGLEAYIQNLANGKMHPRVFIVPVTLSFPLVLEAETLIEDHLKEAGKARYIITDDEFSRPRRVWQFMKDVIRLEASIHVRFCPALDVFGNEVDDDGHSLDKRGRRIDTTRYVLTEGVPCPDPQRDREYTTELGKAISRSFRNHNVVLSTHLLAFAVFRMLRVLNPQLDLYRLLRTGGEEDGLQMTRVYGVMNSLLAIIADEEKEGRIVLNPALQGRSTADVVGEALRYFGSYHVHHVVERRGDRVFAADMNLLYFYHNRLNGHGLETRLDAFIRGESE